jgi:deoxyribodipyrimidine photolyase
MRPLTNHERYDVAVPAALDLPAAGEAAALRRWRDFLADGLVEYGADRDRADLNRTSRMSVQLKWGRSTRARCSRISPGAARKQRRTGTGRADRVDPRTVEAGRRSAERLPDVDRRPR